MDLPVTFDDASVNYGTIDFGGAVSSIIVDPNDASNNVVQTEKTAGAQTWAGTTLAIDHNGTQVRPLPMRFHSRLLISDLSFVFGHHCRRNSNVED